VLDYEATKIENSQIELKIFIKEDQGLEELVLGIQVDPLKYTGDATAGTEIEDKEIELLVQTNPKTDSGKIEDYGRVGEALGKIEETAQPVIDTLTVLGSILSVDVSKQMLNFILTTKLYSRLRVVNVN
jgi:hypothetical protein